MTPRIALLVAGLAAVALPLPAADLAGGLLTLVGLGALGLSVARPGSRAPAVVIGAAALSWLSTPDAHQHGLRLAALALALAAVHTSAALAAVVPSRGAVPLGLLARWAGWTAAATALGAGLVAVLTLLPPAGAAVWPTLVAVLTAGGLAVLATTKGGPRPAPGTTAQPPPEG